MTDETDYEALAARLTDERLPIQPTGGSLAKPLTGEAAAAAGRAFLLEQYGDDEAIEAAIRAGRPKLGRTATSGPSPLVKGRIAEADFAAFKLLEAQTGKKQSELVREAVHLLLERYKLAS
ncbi:ribbon-helix-helix domain-containing protein [Plantibacter sp. Mn2098]|uniref:ribbon-helix-helix domain-containing protein n=1 Tax=Plantibacter sp. Mn2098 TaxID=3395266 RepID=UPI003BD45171